MVRIYSVIIADSENKILFSTFELSDIGFFKRSVVQDMCTFASTETIRRSRPGEKNSYEHQSYICYVSVTESGLSVACVCDTEYPIRIAYDFLSNILICWNNKEFDTIKSMLVSYQDITVVDKISAIRQELTETTLICQETINKLLIREDEIKDLIQKTDNLSIQSKLFLIESEKLNSCCTLF